MRLRRPGDTVGLSVADDGFFVKGVRIGIFKGCARRNECIGDGLASGLTDAELDTC